MARWRDNRLDLGALGEVLVYDIGHNHKPAWVWRWKHDGDGKSYCTDERARRAAVVWLRRALKQAGKRLDNASRRTK
jgi:hypothetical protein